MIVYLKLEGADNNVSDMINELGAYDGVVPQTTQPGWRLELTSQEYNFKDIWGFAFVIQLQYMYSTTIVQ